MEMNINEMWIPLQSWVKFVYGVNEKDWALADFQTVEYGNEYKHKRAAEENTVDPTPALGEICKWHYQH